MQQTNHAIVMLVSRGSNCHELKGARNIKLSTITGNDSLPKYFEPRGGTKIAQFFVPESLVDDVFINFTETCSLLLVALFLADWAS